MAFQVDFEYKFIILVHPNAKERDRKQFLMIWNKWISKDNTKAKCVFISNNTNDNNNEQTKTKQNKAKQISCVFPCKPIMHEMSSCVNFMSTNSSLNW